MAVCLHPRILSRPGLSFRPSHLPRKFARENLPYKYDSLVVPCGKCINCLKNRQNALVARLRAESEKRGSLAFVTLTYEDKYLPLAQTLWMVDKETGETFHIVSERLDKDGNVVCSSAPDIVHSYRCGDTELFERMRSIKAGECPRYLEYPIPAFSSERFDYYVRITPTVYRKDVQLWLKNARVRYEREFGSKLPDFSYVICQEYGPRSCRPHYHLAFMGLSEKHLRYLLDSWKLGFSKLSMIPAVNPDGSDAFAIVSKYIGKYMSKGKFECQSVKDGTAFKPRLCQSIGLGRSLSSKLTARVCAFDMFGAYDLDTFFCPSLGRCLNEDELKQLCIEIPKRLVYRVSPKMVLPVPRIVKQDIFYNKIVITLNEDDEDKPYIVGPYQSIKRKTSVKKMVYKPTSLWFMVSAHIRDEYADSNQRAFRRFLSGYNFGTVAQAVVEFNTLQETTAEISERSGAQNLQTFYSKSKF